jgi:hypothetical protein
VPPPPPQLLAIIDANKQRLNSALRIKLRLARPRRRMNPSASIPAATGQRDCLCLIGATSPAACAATLMLSVAVACPFTVTVEGFRLHVTWLEEVAQASATAPLNSLVDARLMATDAELPAEIENWLTWGARMKSGDTPVATTLNTTGALSDP